MNFIPVAIWTLVIAWGIAFGGLDGQFATLMQRWRRKRFQPDAHVDATQAAADEHVAVLAPNAAVALAIVTPAGTRQVFAGRLDGKDSPTPDANTSFEIGSISKTFTAALLVAMLREGVVQLDTPLDGLLAPDARLGQQIPAPVTLASLATHTSGLPRLPWGWRMALGLFFSPMQPYRLISDSALWRWLRHRRIRFGRRYRYSNLGYGVLGHVLALASGNDYPSALKKFVLDPLQLANTHATPDATCAQPHTALGRRAPAWDMRALAPAGGVRSTLADMTRWLEANIRNTPPLDARLHIARENSGGRHRSMALAWHVDGEADRRVVWHNGRTGGSSAVIALAPAHGVGIVVLSNSAASVDALGMRLLHAAVAGAEPQSGSAIPTRMQPINELL
ncbi:MAG TPA: serine hydrolase domain-containing protein [Rhodanobacteraceae bacterium]